MWRKCDLHRHSISDDPKAPELSADDFVSACLSEGLDVVAVTNHDSLTHIEPIVAEADAHELVVVPGIEISTDRGHVLALSPGPNGLTVLTELVERVPIIQEQETSFGELLKAWKERRTTVATSFRDHVLLIAAHADATNSILTSRQPPSVTNQVAAIQRLDAIEVVDSAIMMEWSKGIKQTAVVKPLLRGSDFHPHSDHQKRATWLYLPAVDVRSIRHALATHESSVSHDASPPEEPRFWIESIRFEGGQYGGRHVSFSPRSNAIIGPPSSGKSLIIDAIRFAFGQTSELADVQDSVDRRLDRCLPAGTSVILTVRDGDQISDIRRTTGGTDVPSITDQPIAFSQAELSRRAMEPIPSVHLLDLHCPEGHEIRLRIAEIAQDVEREFVQLTTSAEDARKLRDIVDNDQEGLEATRKAYLDLVGNDETAQALKDLGSIELWHEEADKALEAWRSTMQVPAPPDLPNVPRLHRDTDSHKYVPENVLEAPSQDFRTAVFAAADNLRDTVVGILRELQPNVAALRREVESALGTDLQESHEASDEATRLKERLIARQQEQADLLVMDQSIGDGIERISEKIEEARDQWQRLRQARKNACREVNQSMVGFFVRLTEESQTDTVDGLLRELRVGTRLQENTLNELRQSLNRVRFVGEAIRSQQFANHSDESRRAAEVEDNLERVAKQAMERSKYKEIAELAVTWPEDGIDLLYKGEGGVNTNFNELTEGLKALAIKEISLAASQRPAVTDQPEDAVPTTAVFEKLVPTIRQQRVSRQFIVASHDANVVVSGDMENVIVLPAHPHEAPIQGTLFDSEIRTHAVGLLEGGEQAFRLRRERYGEYEND